MAMVVGNAVDADVERIEAVGHTNRSCFRIETFRVLFFKVTRRVILLLGKDGMVTVFASLDLKNLLVSFT